LELGSALVAAVAARATATTAATAIPRVIGYGEVDRSLLARWLASSTRLRATRV
jgi:hypothetical protein